MKFNVYALYNASKYLGEIEAESKEEAVDKADTVFAQSLYVDLCHQCAHEVELNSDPYKLEAEPA